MKQARIKCLCKNYRIHDLKLSLSQGQEVVLTEKEVSLSKDLLLAKQIKAVSVQYEQLCQEQRPPQDGTLQKKKPLRQNVRPPNLGTPAKISVPPVVESKATVFGDVGNSSLLWKELDSALKGLSKDLSAQLKGTLAFFQATATEKNTALPPSVSAISEAQPQFIPGGLVGKMAGVVDVKTENVENDQIDAATKLLKQRKKKDS